MHRVPHEARDETWMLAVGDRLMHEFPHLPVITVAKTMSAVRRHGASHDRGELDPDAVYRLAHLVLARDARG